MITPSHNIAESIRAFFRKPGILPRLILVNIGIFLLVFLTSLIWWLFAIETDEIRGMSPLIRWMAVPSELKVLASKPWTIITYMFLHEGFLHLFFNMLILYFGGIVFLQYLNQRQLMIVYLSGGLFGALVFILSYNVFPIFSEIKEFSVALGASASVLAVLIAISSHVPDYKVNLLFIGPVKLKYLAIVFIVLDIFSIKGNNPGGHLAHLGGALWGFAYIQLLKYNFDPFSVFSKRKRKIRVSYKSTNSSRPLNDEEYNRQKAIEQKEIDHILDKISESGYGSLSNREKELLFRSSHKKK
jgi:membrane associated rhomboid family serine protease